MTADKKLRLWELLIDLGFKQIEVGFPSASSHDFDFLRKLIDEGRIPEDVTVQVLTQAREELIVRTFEALKGCKRAVLHFYNSTSTVQRDYVFALDRAGITDIAVKGAQLVKSVAANYPDTEWVFEYSPESFTGTEMDFAVDVCNAVIDVIQPTPENKMIINLPATVEVSTPNVYADQIEWFCDHVNHREALLVSLHTHNDRGGAVAASELGLLAGADRIEGTLLGNGERTGNMDIVTMAMNLYSQGIDPKLDFSKMDEMIAVCKECTQLPLHPRHPYAGELVFTAFSGSHQDAINKCLARRDGKSLWEVAYLPIDPADIGRSYQEVIRINSQSGKGGVAFILESYFGVSLPRPLLLEFSPVIQKLSEGGGELKPDTIWDAFVNEFVEVEGPYRLIDYKVVANGERQVCEARIKVGENEIDIRGEGNGPIDAFIAAMVETLNEPLNVIDYQEYALNEGSQAQAICIIAITDEADSKFYGVGLSQNTITAAFGSIIAAINRKWR